MSAGWLWRLFVGLSLAGVGMGHAGALTMPEMQRLLKSGSMQSVTFKETRESPWLAAPIESRGTMHSSHGLLEKRVINPRQETWRLRFDRLEWAGPDGVATRQILFKDAPAVAALANALRLVVAAELAALETDFRIEVVGDEHEWSVRLQPKNAGVSRHIDYLEIQGKASELQVLVVVERLGERTTTRFQR